MAKAVVQGSLLAFGLAGTLSVPAALAAGDSHVVPGSRAADLEHCVEPTPFMRRNHMELILHQRDVTVHTGIRSSKYQIETCVSCHVSYGPDKKPIPINADGQFCDSCHEYAAVDLTCFQCHATVPGEGTKSADKQASAHHLPRGAALGTFALSKSMQHSQARGEGN